ncbi:hypothetical protein F4861DRAFT_533020 [Xylaria intraflava]|nr:hypothetical protein F4861DRAFT_533020 [Xylaria intraflava]
MAGGRRKREVSSCIPCYTRKQKCDRQYPCDRCSRRRQPELCAYHSPSFRGSTQTVSPDLVHDEGMDIGGDFWGRETDGAPRDSSTALNTSTAPQRGGRQSSMLADTFGYYGQSALNTMALVRKLIHEDDSPEARDIPIPETVEAEVRKWLEGMVSRPIIDFLIRHFVSKVNWIDQLLYPPWFLAQYQKWWRLDRMASVADIEFAILVMRICHYASQFLPSPAYTVDSVNGVALADIRKSCEQVINALGPICTKLDPRGSLIRVQHIALGGLACVSTGRMNAFWESISCASRVAQQIGLHLDTNLWPGNMNAMEKEMRRRSYCNLYIWDSCLSKRLDRTPFLHDTLSNDIMPQMRLVPNVDLGADAPDVFTERAVRALLAQFWRSHSPPPGSEHDAVAAEERYETFCNTFLRTIPPAFSLTPDKQWDERLSTLPMQRQQLQIAIYEYLCWNYSPTLLLKPGEVNGMPRYKQMMIPHNKRALAAAALNLLDAVSTLHIMMIGGSHTRFPGIITPTFEAAVPLLCLCADPWFPGDPSHSGPNTSMPDPLGPRAANVTRTECMQAAREAQKSLQTLAEASKMAEVGAQTLARLISKVEEAEASQQSYGNLYGEAGPNWEDMLRDLGGRF